MNDDQDQLWAEVVQDRQHLEDKIHNAVREFNNKYQRALYVSGVSLMNVNAVGGDVRLMHVKLDIRMKGDV